MSPLVVTRTARHGIVGFAAVALLAGVIALSVGTDRAIITTESELPAAEFALFDGGNTTFAEFEGKPLVINFWASWCPACVNELPEFQAVHEEIGDDVTFLGLANADSRAAAESLAAEIGVTYTLADDPQGDLFRTFELFSMPSTLFVTADGQVTEVVGGQLTADSLAEKIDNLRSQ